MAVSKAQQKAVNKYMAANYDRINLTVPKGKKDTIQAHAETQGESVNGFINRAISETMKGDSGENSKAWMNEEAFFEWYTATASQEDKKVFERVGTFEELFEDMTFSDGTPTFELVKCQSQMAGSDEWFDDVVPLPDEIEYFSYSYFTYHVKELDGVAGCFNAKERSLFIDPVYLNDDSVILHEMIHLHEFVIDSLPFFFHDAIYFCLYRSLRGQIDDLDERIEAHGHILNSTQIAQQGGTHDILFLLKSFDLDLKMGYKLGTIFGYGMVDEDYSVSNHISHGLNKGTSEALQGPPGGSVASLPSEAYKCAVEASEAAGEGLPDFVARAVTIQAKRDEAARKLGGGK